VQLHADSRVDTAVVDAFACLRCAALSARWKYAAHTKPAFSIAVLKLSRILRRDLRLHMPPTEALIAARCMELLNMFSTSLLADLRQLSDADAETFPDQPRCSRLSMMYSEVNTLHMSIVLNVTWVCATISGHHIAGCALELQSCCVTGVPKTCWNTAD